MKALIALGCDYEGPNKSSVPVNIRLAWRLQSVHQYLVQCKATWEHADSRYAELFPDEA